MHRLLLLIMILAFVAPGCVTTSESEAYSSAMEMDQGLSPYQDDLTQGLE